MQTSVTTNGKSLLDKIQGLAIKFLLQREISNCTRLDVTAAVERGLARLQHPIKLGDDIRLALSELEVKVPGKLHIDRATEMLSAEINLVGKAKIAVE